MFEHLMFLHKTDATVQRRRELYLTSYSGQREINDRRNQRTTNAIMKIENNSKQPKSVIVNIPKQDLQPRAVIVNIKKPAEQTVASVPATFASVGSPANGMTASTIKEYLAALIADTPKIAASLAPCQTEFVEMRAEKLREGNFLGYLITFESHERLRPFIDIIPRLSDQEYWRLLREVWIDAEVVLPDKKIWLRLLRWKRPGREHLMTDPEHAALAAMPDEIKIWRGCGDQSAVRGLSWTLDQDRAMSFAERACGERIRHLTGLCGTTPLLVQASCYKSDVLAYFMAREESELVVIPRTVNVRKKSPIQSKKVSVLTSTNN